MIDLSTCKHVFLVKMWKTQQTSAVSSAILWSTDDGPLRVKMYW